MSVVTSVSRVTGFFRATTQAAVLGTGVIGNAYTTSNVLPNQIYELFVGGLLSSIFIPLLVSRLANNGEEDSRNLANALATLILPFLAVVALLGVLFAEPLVGLATNWGASNRFSREQAEQAKDLAVLLFRVFALQIFFYGIGALATGVLNAHRRFFLPTFAPILNNLTVVAAFGGYFLLAPRDPLAAIYLLAFGTTLGVVVMSLMLLPAVWRLGYRPRVRLRHPALGSAARLAGPLLVFVASSVGIQVFATFLGTGFFGVAQLQFAFVIFQLPYGVFVVAIATALVPELSERYARGDTDGYREGLSFGLRTMAFIVIPASVGMITLPKPIVGLLYERGKFGANDTEQVSALLVAYGFGLLGYAAYFVLVRSFYARQNTKAPATLNVGLLVLYIALAYTLSNTSMGLVGIAVAFSLSYAILALALLAATRRDLKRLGGRRLLRSLLKILASGAVMYAVATAGTALLGTGSNALDRLAILALVGGASLAAYLGTAHLLRAEELKGAAALLKRRRAPTAPNRDA